MCQITFIAVLISDPFACSHHRAADYFTESILSDRGFWGWPCNSYYSYLLGMCPRSNELHLAGEDCRESTKGMFLITTNSESPFASGQWTLQPTSKYPSNSRRDPFLERIDEYGKLESAFNFANSYHKLSTPQSPSSAAAATSVPFPFSHSNNFRPYEPLTNQINQNDFDTTMNHDGGGDKSRFDLYNVDDDGDLKLSSTTERWRHNDKFRVENPLASAFNRTMSEILHQQQQQQLQQQSGSSDEFQFQFPKVTY